MTKLGMLRYSHALIAFIGVLLLGSLIADSLVVAQQRRHRTADAQRNIQHEMALLGTTVREALLSHNYQTVEQFLNQWAMEDNRVVEIKATAPNGFILVHYQRKQSTEHPLPAEHDVRFRKQLLMHLEMVRDFAPVEEELDSVRNKLITVSLFFVSVLGMFLWVTVSRMALLPMEQVEQELRKHRHRLEHLVQERTSELSASNQKLRAEIAERENVEEALRSHAERLRTLRTIDQAILAARSPEEIAENALSHIHKLVPCQRVCVTVFDRESRQATILAVSADSETRLKAGNSFSLDITGLPERLQQGEVLYVEDIKKATQLTPMEETLREEGVGAYLIIPLINRGQLIGTLHLGSKQPGQCAPQSMVIAHEIAELLAVAIQQSRLHAQVERHAAELEQRVAERTAELQETNKELEAFAYSVSHDLRSHLSTVQGFADFLSEQYTSQLDAEGQDLIASIIDSTRSMDALIGDLLAYSRLSRTEFHMESLSLEPVVDEVLVQLDTTIQEKEAQIEVVRPLGEVMGVRPVLQQIISNLLSNALKFVAPGVKPHIRIWLEQMDSHSRLWVEDNGIGIAAEDQERIFQVFERLPGAGGYPGTGIGLATVQRGVSRMGGRVGVDSEVGHGSRFWVELPGTITQAVA